MELWIELTFIGVGSFLIGASGFFVFNKAFKTMTTRIFRGKKIKECKEELRKINLAGIPRETIIDTYVSNGKIQNYSPEIISEGEILYFKQKQFDDLVDYLLLMDYNFDEVLIKRFKIFRKLNVNHLVIKTLIEHNWKKRIIKRALIKIEKGVKENGKPRRTTSFPRFEKQIKQDLEESTSSASPRASDSARGITRTSSNESGTSPSIPREFAQFGNLQNGEIAPKRESMERAKKYFN
jgi:hypothetical protein